MLQLARTQIARHGVDLGGRLREVHVDRIDLLHPREQRGRVEADQRAFGDFGATHASRDRRDDARIAEIELGLADFGTGGQHLGACTRLGRTGLGVFTRADGALFEQAAIALDLVAGRIVLGLRFGERAARGVQCGRQRLRIDAEQHIAPGDFLAFLVFALDDDAARTRTHVGAAEGFKPSRLLGRERLGTALDRAHDGFGRSVRDLFLAAIRAGGEEQNTGDQTGGHASQHSETDSVIDFR